MANTEDKHTRDTQPIPHRPIGEEPADPVPAEMDESPSQEPAGLGDYPSTAVEQDRIPTPVPLEAPPNDFGPSRPRASWAMRLVVGLCLLLSLASLALNAILIQNLLTVQQTFADEVDQAIAALDDVSGELFSYEYRFQQTIPFEGDIPFKQDLVIPFQGNIPIETTVQVPIDAGILGTFVIDVPIDTDFYVDLEVPVTVDQTFHVKTEVPVDMTIPISISADDPAIQQLLDGVRQWLIDLRASF